jgi:hypothetical protein
LSDEKGSPDDHPVFAEPSTGTAGGSNPTPGAFSFPAESISSKQHTLVMIAHQVFQIFGNIEDSGARNLLVNCKPYPILI